MSVAAVLGLVASRRSISRPAVEAVAVRAGGGELVVDEMRHQLLDGTIALVPRGASRSIAAGSDGISYLTVHRRRGPLTIGAAPLG